MSSLRSHRIVAIVLRHLYHIRHTFFVLPFYEIFCWPVIDVVLWAYAGIWFQQESSSLHIIGPTLLISALLWQLIMRFNHEVSMPLLVELQSHNIGNLFCTPLQLGEWIIAVIVIAFLLVGVTTIFLMILALALYGMYLTDILWPLVPLWLSVMMSGITLGLFVSALMMRFGRCMGENVYRFPLTIVPLSCVYYSVTILPGWMQSLSTLVPMAYTFDALRQFIATGIIPSQPLMLSFVLNGIYGILTLVLFKYFYEKSREHGLTRLSD